MTSSVSSSVSGSGSRPGTTPVIVAGVDGSDCSRRALRWAMQEAGLRGATLRVVSCFETGETHRHRAGEGLRARTEDDARAALETIVEEELRVRSSAAAVTGTLVVERVVAHASGSGVAGVLLRHAEDAELLVVGARGAGPLRRLLLGSVSQACVDRATGPVVVVR